MEKKEFLNEEKYQKNSKKITLIAKVIVCIGIGVIALLLFLGFSEKSKINKEYSQENINAQIKELNDDLVVLEENLKKSEQNLTDKKLELENSIVNQEDEIKKLKRVKFDGFNDAYYERQDKIEELEKQIAPVKKKISVIENYFSSSSHCSFYDSFESNTKVLDDVCDDRGKINEKKAEISKLENLDLEHEIRFNDKSFGFFMFIPFVAILTFGITMVLLSISKRREIMSYGMQSVMPVAQEGIEKMAPTVGKAGKSIAKEMAPIYGEIAKEISKGIKDGLNDEEK